MTELIARLGQERVHAVRHSFEPSQPLSKLIQEFTRHTVEPRFLLHSTKTVFVDSREYIKKDDIDFLRADIDAHEAIKEASDTQFVIGRVALERLFLDRSRARTSKYTDDTPDKYRMKFMPVDTVAFNELENTLDGYPPAREPEGREDYFFYLDVRGSVVRRFRRGREDEREFKQTIEENIGSKLFSAAVTGIGAKQLPAVIHTR